MIFHIACKSQDQHDKIVDLIRAFALQKRSDSEINDDAPLTREDALIREFSNTVVPSSRFHLLDMTANPVVEVGVPDDKTCVYRDYIARTIDDQSIFNNVYWYLRDASTPTHITFVLSDERDFDSHASRLQNMTTATRAKVKKYLAGPDAKSVLTPDDKKFLGKDDTAYQLWSWTDVKLDLLRKIMLSVFRKQRVELFDPHVRVHASLYNRENPLSLGWASFCDYKNPFTGRTRKGRGEAVTD